MRNIQRILSFHRRKPCIAAAQCQPVFLTHNRTTYNFQSVEPYLFHHFTNNSQLLEVFLAEISTGRVYNHKQLAHYLAYSIKMSWTETAFHHCVQRRITELPGIRLRINLFYRRSKNKSRSYFFQQFTIGIQCTRIFCQVIFVVKLGRIYKITYHHYIIFCNSTFHQRSVSGMECTHCRHQTYCLSLTAQGIQL